MEMNFDPMTGKPIKAEPTQMRFDPMTGEPIKAESTQIRFDPMTGKPIGRVSMAVKKKKLNKGQKALIIMVSIVMIFAIGVWGVCSGTFLDKSGKVAVAMANTLIESADLLQNMDQWKIVKKDRNSGVRVASLSNSLPLVVAQGYRTDSIGFLDDILKEYWTQNSLDGLNRICDNLYEAMGRRENVITLVKLFMEEYKTLDFRDAGTKIFEIDGRDCKSKGYRTTLDSDFMSQILDDIEDLAEGDMERYFDSDTDTEQMFDLCQDMMDDFPDMDVTFYIYKNKLACIEFEYDFEDIQIAFSGGSTRMQNIQIIENGEIATEIRAR